MRTVGGVFLALIALFFGGCSFFGLSLGLQDAGLGLLPFIGLVCAGGFGWAAVKQFDPPKTDTVPPTKRTDSGDIDDTRLR